MTTLQAPCATVLAMVLGALHPGVAGGQGSNAGGTPASVRKADAARLLANVTHCTDSDVRFRTSAGARVFVDPMLGPDNALVKKTGMTKPDLILITHPHRDHFDPLVLREYVKRNPALVLAGPADVVTYAEANRIRVLEVKPGQDYTLAGVRFHTVPAYFLEGPQHPRGSGWVGFVLRIDGATYYVTGDTQPLPEMASVNPDVLFPLVLGCGGNLEQALEMVALCTPCVVVPVHAGGHEEVVREFLTRLPPGVRGAHYEDGRLVVAPPARAP